MSKRKREEDFNHLLNKISKLERKVNRKRAISSSSEDGDDQIGGSVVAALGTQDWQLESEVLEILGHDPTTLKKYARDAHSEIARRFEHFVTEGLSEEKRKELVTKYLIPENCVLIGAPGLNPEIKAALSEAFINRDKGIESKQTQMSSAISCLAEVLSYHLNCRDKNIEMLAKLMDIGRLLCDIQHGDSITRRNLIVLILKKEMKEHLSNTNIDKFLFSENLSEAFKSAKAVSKTVTDLKPDHKQSESVHFSAFKPQSSGPRAQAAGAPAAEPRARSAARAAAVAAGRLQRVARASAADDALVAPLDLDAVKYAGRLADHYDRWALITDDRTVLSWIKGYKIKFALAVTQTSIPSPPTYTQTEISQFSKAINDLLKIGAISECESCIDQYVSRFFLVPKPNGKMRFILNLKNLNYFIQTEHFKLEDLRTATKLITPNCFMATLDLKDAYFLLKIHKDSRKYLRFIFNGHLFEFNVLPFGLSTAPFTFTKLMKPVLKLLRTAGFISTLYLDDWCLVGQTYEQCLLNIETTKMLLVSLGFIVNEEKSMLKPSTSCKFLGVILDSKRFQVNLPVEKRLRIKKQIQKFLKLRRCKIRVFAQLVGLLVSACPAIEYGWLYTKELERCKFLNLGNDNNYDKIMTLPDSLLPDLQWWLQNIDTSVHPIRNDEFCREIYTDSSTSGWGTACNGKRASGQWSESEREQHINYLELLAAFIALKIFANDLRHCQVLLRVDNSTAISYINRMGGIQYPHLTQVARELWQWCERRKIFVYASYIKSCDNVEADEESRRIHPDIEWELKAWAFDSITRAFGKPDIDLFASRINKKCQKYVSWHRDPDAYAVNSFTVCWSDYFFYAFPPFSIILKTLRKIISDNARGIMIVPLWPTQPWFPVFKSLLVSDTVTFEPEKDVLISHSSTGRIRSTLTLVAGVLSGSRSCTERSLTRL